MIHYKLMTEPTPLVRKSIDILKRKTAERSGGTITCGMVAAGRKPDILLDIRPTVGREGFGIEKVGDGTVRIVGNDERGLLYGIGKFLRTARFDAGEYAPPAWCGTSIPDKEVRGVYFATHFHNFYHDAPIEMVERYVEDLALWGCNTLAVWFDMHQYSGMDDPAARAMVARLRAILHAANAVGMGAALTTVSNEAFYTSPVELRAEWTAGHNGYFREPGHHYHVELCPNKPGGLELILKWRQEMLEAFDGIDIEYVWCWPYDQGGCTCARCAPWGSNGFLKTAEAEAELVRRYFPDAKIILSTWYFDHFINHEWEGLAEVFCKETLEWVDFIMADDNNSSYPEYPLINGVPGGVGLLSFPEISMYRMAPWGGYGANPLPRHLEEIWQQCGVSIQGGFPYSEGVFEDINKAIVLQFYWDETRTARETVTEYFAGEYSPRVVEHLLKAVEIMESNHHHHPHGGKEHSFDVPVLARTEECLALVEKANNALPSFIRKSWRWRIFYLRAAIDAELYRAGRKATGRLDAYMEELVGMYCAQKADRIVAPPSLKTLELYWEKEEKQTSEENTHIMP